MSVEALTPTSVVKSTNSILTVTHCDFTDTNSDDRKLLLCVIIGAGSGMAGMASHTNLKFSMAATYQSAEIWAVDFQENH